MSELLLLFREEEEEGDDNGDFRPTLLDELLDLEWWSEDEEERWVLLLLFDFESLRLSEDFLDESSGSVTSHLLTFFLDFSAPLSAALPIPAPLVDESSKALEMALAKALEVFLERILAPALVELFSFSSSESLDDSYMLRVAASECHIIQIGAINFVQDLAF